MHQKLRPCQFPAKCIKYIYNAIDKVCDKKEHFLPVEILLVSEELKIVRN